MVYVSAPALLSTGMAGGITSSAAYFSISDAFSIPASEDAVRDGVVPATREKDALLARPA
jgi:hypothetical protein